MKSQLIFKWMAFTCLLLLARIWMNQHWGILFLVWNLFLAALPVYFSKKAETAQRIETQVLWLLAAVLFLPNAPYLITDLFHLHKVDRIPLWIDLILLFNFSILGILLFVSAWKTMYRVLERQMKSKHVLLVFKGAHLLLCGYGIYLGRYLRFNSWDVVTQPFTLLHHMYGSIFWPHHAKETIGISVTFGVLLYLVLELFERQQPLQLTKHYELFEEKKSSL